MASIETINLLEVAPEQNDGEGIQDLIVKVIRKRESRTEKQLTRL